MEEAVIRYITLADLQKRTDCPACHSPESTDVAKRTAFQRREDFPIGTLEISPEVALTRKLLRVWYVSHILRDSTMKEVTELPATAARWKGTTRPGYRRSKAAMESFPNGVKKLMDVGAHTGLFLDSLGDGIEKTALEANAASCAEIAQRGNKVIVGTLESATPPESYFDAVTALDVLEHFYSPDLAIAAVARSLKPNGLFIFETGTTDCQGAALLRGGWYYSSYLEHFQVFNSLSLDSLLSSAGFERVSLTKEFHGEKSFSYALKSMARLIPFLLTTAGGRYANGWDSFCRALNPRTLASPPWTGLLERDHLFGVYRLRK